MRSRFIVYALAATVLVGGIAFAADALVESDEEQLEQLVGDLTAGDAGGRVDAVLRWTDPSREPVTIARGRQTVRLGEDDAFTLADEMTDTLAPLVTHDRVELVQRSVRVDGDRGTVAVRVRAEGDLVNVTIQLRRSGQGWLITDVRAHG